MSITISHPTGVLKGRINIPLSKSESNRLLILQALSKGKIKVDESGLSDARDTRLLQAALASDDMEINVEDAGTAMRFLTAYYCANGQHKILTGSERMQERPIGILVSALRDIGFNIQYLKNEGFPPIEIMPTDLSILKNEVSIAANVSSQYISALIMIAPILPDGLTIHFTTALSSAPYIGMTLELMSDIGLYSGWIDGSLQIGHQDFRNDHKSAMGDWSAASYWFSMAVLAQEPELILKDLNADTYQGDAKIAVWSGGMGVSMRLAEFGGYYLYKPTDSNPTSDFYLVYPDSSGTLYAHKHSDSSENSTLHFDFTDHPDLAQTMIVLCAAKNINATFTGLESLRIKETDRIAALQNELRKFGVQLTESDKGKFELSGTFTMSHQTIKTYNDHRMAMAFAPLALLGEITIENPEVVEKSYPSFWEQMSKVGFKIV